jgi:hypothetical protein
LNAAKRSDRKRPPVPIEGGRVVAGMGSGSGFLGGVKIGALGGDLTHAVSVEGEAVGVVDEAVEDGVGDGGIADHCRMPLFQIDWCLKFPSLILTIRFAAIALS